MRSVWGQQLDVQLDVRELQRRAGRVLELAAAAGQRAGFGALSVDAARSAGGAVSAAGPRHARSSAVLRQLGLEQQLRSHSEPRLLQQRLGPAVSPASAAAAPGLH
jgi:hypothetical protein